MDKKHKKNDHGREKATAEKIQKRMGSLFDSKAQLPAPISIQQAEDLKARISELEEKLSQPRGAQAVKSSKSNLLPSAVMAAASSEAATPRQKKRVWRWRDLSLRIKLPLTVIFLLVLAFVVATLLSVRAARASLVDTLGNELIAQTSLQAELIRSYLTWTRSMAIDLAAAAEVSNFDEQTNLETIRQTLQRNDQIFGSTIAYEPYQFLPAKYYWSPYFSRASDGTLQFTQLGNPEYNYFQWDWYSLPKKENAPVLSPPYFDEGGGNIWMVTWSVPFYDDAGKFKGVATTDMSFQQTQEIVHQIEVGQQGYAFLINQQGTVLGIGEHGGEYQVMEDSLLATAASQQTEDWKNLIQSMTEGKSGFVEVTDPQGKSLFVAYEPIELETGWYLALAYPQDELFQPAEQLQNTLILVSILITVIASIILFLFTQSITLPIQRLARQAKLFSQGELDLTNIEDRQPILIQTHNELNELGDAFNRMISTLAHSFQNLEERVADRTRDLELASQVGRTVTEKVTDLHGLLSESVAMIRARFELYYTQIYLLDPAGHSLTLRAGTGEAGAELMKRGHHLALGSGSINGRAAGEKRPIIVSDTQKSENFLPNPLLPHTRSEMAVPLIASGKVVGVLDMQSGEPDALNETNLPAFEALAGQLAIAIQNASLFSQIEEARAEVEEQARHATAKGWGDYLNAVDRGETMGYVYDQRELLPLADAADLSLKNTIAVPITVTGANVGQIRLTDEDHRAWSQSDMEIVHAASEQLARQVENLRLLAQTEQYRAEAEQAVRRLTREGWETYFQSRKEAGSGYTYNLNEVQPLSNGEHHGNVSLKRSLSIRDENIGELAVDTEVTSDEAEELIGAIASRLSAHLENLRLLEQAEQGRFEVEQGEARLRTLVDHAPEAIVVVDLTTGFFSEPNENALKLYGLPREELIKVGPAQMSPPTQPDGRDSTEKAMERIGEAMQGGAPVFDWTHRNAQGQDIPCEVRLVRLPGDRPQVRASVTDITERKKTQEIIAQRANQLETVSRVSIATSTVLDPDQLLQTVVDLTKERFNLYHAHIYLADEAWQTLLLAAGAGEVGRALVAEEHAIAMNAEKSLVARAARERVTAIVNDVRADSGFLPNPLLPETRSEMAVPMIVGDKLLGVFDVQADQTGIFTEEDARIYLTLAAQVAVALQNARLYVEQSATLTQLRELDRLKSSFLANMSHELRTPLNSILGFADVMLEELDGPLTENMNTDLRLIQKNGQHLLHLINDVLDMAKIEAGRMNLSPEHFRVQELLEDVTSIASQLANEKSLALVIEETSDPIVEIHADRTRLRQVMINLVNNALKFTEQGRISICAEQRADLVLVTVRDTGVGIPPDKLEAVFQEFTQVDTSTTRKAGGTGLGLPISRRLIEMHGGRLWAESTGVNGAGSTFFVELPLEAKMTEPVEKVEK